MLQNESTIIILSPLGCAVFCLVRNSLCKNSMEHLVNFFPYGSLCMTFLQPFCCARVFLVIETKFVFLAGLVVLIHWISSVCLIIQEVQWMVFHLTGTISPQAYQISMVMDVFMSMYNMIYIFCPWVRTHTAIDSTCSFSSSLRALTKSLISCSFPQSHQGRQS